MLNRFTKSLHSFAPQKASQSASLFSNVRTTARGFLTTAHRTVTVLGLVAIAVLGTLIVKPHFADHIKTLSPFSIAVAPAVAMAPTSMSLMDMPAKPFTSSAHKTDIDSDVIAAHISPTIDRSASIATQREQQWVTNWLAKRYRVAGDATNMLVSAAYTTAKDTKLDPLLILSVMAIESGFNPFAESAVGAQGLMQVMSKVHHDKFQELGGIKAALNPVANIKVGALILKEYVKRGGSVEAGLKLYVGAAAFENDAGYGSKVLAEYRRLKDVASGKSVPIFSTPATVTQKIQPVEPLINKTPSPVEADAVSPNPNVVTLTPNQVAAL